MSEIAIHVRNISKMYRLGAVSTKTLYGDLNRWWSKVRGREDPFASVEILENHRTHKSDFVWSLKDISFDVMKGETIGIIGKNGAGKSTLLKILSRITNPTSGDIKARGRIASLLEVGTGFHPEFTGRENIYMNGAILGMTRKEVSSKLSEIIDFSGVEAYIDTPVKRYSSGMYIRLAFSVAAHLQTDILILDEVLSVGDIEFQKKCFDKMEIVCRKEGKTIIYVSHTLSTVERMCNHAIYLKNGTLNLYGPVKEVISVFSNDIFPGSKKK
ncbi:MAG: ABC transporter ATP-binding protein [Saprospiraceae bacterium]